MVVFNVQGIIPPVFTPMHEDQTTINYSVIKPYAQYIAEHGMKAILVGGTSGEFMKLGVDDRKKVIDEWLKEAKVHGFHVQVQVGGVPMAEVIEMAKYCQAVGVDSIMTLPELFFKSNSVEELVHYVELVANAAPQLPVLYHHFPFMTNVEVSMPDFVKAATARIPTFKGIKFSSHNLIEAEQVLRILKDGQQIFMGADSLIAPAVLLGIKSCIVMTSNMFSTIVRKMMDYVGKNDEKARLIQQELREAIEAHTAESLSGMDWVPCMKAGMESFTGIKVGPPALPERPISEEAKKRIAAKLKEIGVIRPPH